MITSAPPMAASMAAVKPAPPGPTITASVSIVWAAPTLANMTNDNSKASTTDFFITTSLLFVIVCLFTQSEKFTAYAGIPSQIYGRFNTLPYSNGNHLEDDLC